MGRAIAEGEQMCMNETWFWCPVLGGGGVRPTPNAVYLFAFVSKSIGTTLYADVKICM